LRAGNGLKAVQKILNITYQKRKDMQKSYVRITNATRQYLWQDSGLCKAHIETQKYREREIGLLHPEIVEFYSDLEKNMMRTSKGKIAELFGKPTDAYMKLPQSRKWQGDESFIFYKPYPRDIPILMYDTRMDGNKGYFIATLRKGEFEIVPNPKTEMPYLEAFDILMKGKIFEIPIEVAEHEVSKERAKSLERYLRELKEIDLRRARSQSQM
jgi:hypothetical protein